MSPRPRAERRPALARLLKRSEPPEPRAQHLEERGHADGDQVRHHGRHVEDRHPLGDGHHERRGQPHRVAAAQRHVAQTHAQRARHAHVQAPEVQLRVIARRRRKRPRRRDVRARHQVGHLRPAVGGQHAVDHGQAGASAERHAQACTDHRTHGVEHHAHERHGHGRGDRTGRCGNQHDVDVHAHHGVVPTGCEHHLTLPPLPALRA
jgi:hypothetical protein